MKQLLDSLKKSIEERAASPLAGTYGISWLAYNFELVVIALGAGKFNDKQTALVEFFATHSDLKTYGVPLLATLFYILIFPAFIHASSMVALLYKKELLKMQYRLKGLTPCSFDDIQEKDDQIHKLQQELRDVKGSLNVVEAEAKNKMDALLIRTEQEKSKLEDDLKVKLESIDGFDKELKRLNEELQSERKSVAHLTIQLEKNDNFLTLSKQKILKLEDFIKDKDDHIERCNQKLSNIIMEQKSNAHALNALREVMSDLTQELLQVTDLPSSDHTLQEKVRSFALDYREKQYVL